MQKKRLSFKTKILLTFLLLSSSAVLFTGYFNYRTATDIVANQAIRMNEQNVAKSAQAFDEKLKKILQSLNSIMFTEDFKQMLKDASAGKSDTYYAHMSRLQSMFTQIKFNERLIQSILITTPIGDFYSYSDQRKKTEFRDTELYERISQQHRAIWVESHEDQLFGDQTRVLSFVMELNVDGYTSDNYIVININEKGLKDFLYQSTDQPDEELLLVSSSGNLVIQSQSPYASMMNEPFISNTLAEPLNFEDQAFEVTLSDETYLINLTNLDTVKSWVLIGIQSKSELLHDVKRIQWTTIIIIFLCLIAMLILSRLLTAILTKPLLRLYKVMKNVEYRNDLSVRYEHGSNDDEFSQLGNRFNMMMDEIGQLIHGIEQAEAEKRKAEVMALTAQIDPHFFYNTLNTIYWKAELEKLDDVKNMILSFSRLFELGLNKGEELMTIEQEIEHVSQYLKLQKYCYEQKFDYDIEVDSRIDTSLLTLKLILQPLVENSILHGFKEIRRGGQIHVKLLRRARHDAEYMKQAIDQFNKSNSDNIEVVFTGLSENFNQALEVAFASGQAPDIFQSYDLPTYVLKDYLEPFDDYMTDEHYEKFGSNLKDNINTFNDKIYSLPSFGYTYRLIYNADLFEKAGISAPPTSMAEMVEYAKKITDMGKKDGIYGFALNFKNPQNAFDRSVRQILPISGYGEFGYDTKTGRYDFAPYSEAVEYFKKMYEDGSMMPGIESLDIDPLRAQFTEGKIGMYFSFSVETGVYQDQFPTDINWKAAQAPSLDGKQYGPSPTLAGSWISMSKESKHKEAAWKFIEFMYSDEIMKGYHEAGLGLSVIPSVTEISNAPDIKGTEYFIPTNNDGLWPAAPKIKPEGLAYGDVFFEYMLNGGNIDAIVQDLNTRYNTALDKAISRGDVTLKADPSFDPSQLFVE